MKIENLEDFEAWLKDQPQEVHIAIAMRAALRLWPLVSATSNWRDHRHDKIENLALVTGWAILISAAAAEGSAYEVSSAARAAGATVARSADDAPETTAEAAGRAADAVDAAAGSTDAAATAGGPFNPAIDVRGVTAIMDASTNVFDPVAREVASAARAASLKDADFPARQMLRQPLWHDAGPPVGLRPEEIGETLLDTDPNFAFFKRWYGGMVAGRRMPAELLRRIATKIPPETWESGAEPVAREIERIEAEWMHEQAAINETLVLDDVKLLYSAKPLAPSNAERLALHLSRVDDALDDVLALGGNNGLTERTAEYRIIKRLIRKYPDDPERVVFDLTDVNQSIRRQIDVGEYADDEPIRLLQSANTACVLTICDMQPEVAQELQRVYPPSQRVLDDDEVDLLETALTASAAMLDKPAAETTVEDKAEIVFGEIIDAARDAGPVGPRRMAATYRSIVLRRQISRLSQLAGDWTRIPKLSEHYDSDLSKAAGVVARYGGVARLFYSAVVRLGWLLGL